MILPIVAYGDPVLRKVGSQVLPDYPELQTLIQNMWETMYAAHGVGLAAPQIGKSLQLFIIDTGAFDDEKTPGRKQVFLNAQIIQESGNHWEYEEGCLSIPHIRENVSRQEQLNIRYQDENFQTHQESFNGLAARVIQHEFDHCQGILFVDHLSQLKKRLLKSKLTNISKGATRVDYRMRFPNR